jgi:hypothetical protein
VRLAAQAPLQTDKTALSVVRLWSLLVEVAGVVIYTLGRLLVDVVEEGVMIPSRLLVLVRKDLTAQQLTVHLQEVLVEEPGPRL